jgi:hypothetical protein
LRAGLRYNIVAKGWQDLPDDAFADMAELGGPFVPAQA